MFHSLIVAMLPLMLGAVTAGAAPAPEDDRATIAAIVTKQAQAWNKHDAKAFAERFAADGGFTNIVGMQTYGKAPFEQQHAFIFSSIYKDSSLKMTIVKLRFVRPDVVVLDVDCELSGYGSLPPGMAAPADGILRTKLQEVLVKESTGWWVTAFHNVVALPMPPRPLFFAAFETVARPS